MSRALTFLWERFPPLAYLPLIAGLYAAAMVLAGGSADSTSAVGALALTLVFLHLRLFDERKDYEHDTQHNPDRPLPRGLVTVGELRVAWLITIGAELGLAAWLGVQPLLAMAVVIGYSWVMLNEFWISGWIRPRLYTYAVSHTLITPLMLLFVMTAETGRAFWDPPPGYLWFALAGWPLFLVFEVARKTYAPEDEREGVNTYSSLHSPGRATLLVFGNGALATAGIAAALSANEVDSRSLVPLVTLLALGCIPYARAHTRRNAKLLQGFATVFLLLACVVPAIVAR